MKVVFFPGAGLRTDASYEADLSLTSTSAPSPILNPTWGSAFGWMEHRSMLVHAARSPAPSSAAVDVRLPTIVVVAAAPAAIYRVVHEQDEACPNGEPGWRQQVIAVRDADSHPLVATVINQRTGLFCALDYQESVEGSGAVAAQGSAELRFATTGPYYLMTGAHFSMHAESERGPASMSAEISLSDFEPLR
ncbi:MAG TPA: hypothetical protein VMD91_02435 [Candidatus Sulfotelmatobacter sp.]|nr:hypothetical protein [Candidatus Sulfotelmatobacter sp.]